MSILNIYICSFNIIIIIQILSRFGFHPDFIQIQISSRFHPITICSYILLYLRTSSENTENMSEQQVLGLKNYIMQNDLQDPGSQTNSATQTNSVQPAPLYRNQASEQKRNCYIYIYIYIYITH